MYKRLNHLNNLRSFESAARHRSYSKAAVELFVSQAAVSQQMRQLETSLGVKLFMRRGREMQLTQSGEKLFDATHKAFNILLQSFSNIECEDVAGSLTVTSTQSFASLWLMPRLYRFSSNHPEIKISVVASNDFVDLQQSHIDLAIRFGEGAEKATDDDLTCEPVGQDDVYPVCSPLLVKQMNLKKPEDILKCWLVGLSQAGREDWQTWFENAGVKNFQTHDMWTEVTSSDLALSAVLSGHGVAIVSESVFSQYIESGQLIIPFNIKHPNAFKRYLVYDPNSAKKKRLNIFKQWLKEEMSLQNTPEPEK